jgi:hypothetical protein
MLVQAQQGEEPAMLDDRVVHKPLQTVREKSRRMATSRSRFVPRVSELETRTLLSNIAVVSTADSGTGSLRAAIASAAPGDVITFAKSLRGQTITLASPVDVGTSLTIRGFAGGPVISGNGATEIFSISSGVSVNLTTLKMVNGSAASGGAIDNSGTLLIRSCVLQNNDAVGNATTAGSGGAIDNENGASLTIINSNLSGNESIDNVVSGSAASGGAIESAPGSVTTIRGTTFSFNQAISGQGPNGRADGGAIDLNSAVLTITASRFNGNIAVGYSMGQSGAINNRQGTVTIATSVFSSNKAMAVGTGGSAASGAITNVGSTPASTTMTIRSTSFTRNQAIAASGGDGVTTMSGAFGGAMGTSGSGVIVNVSTSSFIANQAIAAMPSSTSTGNVLAGIAVGGAIENDTTAIFNVRSSVITGNRALGGSSGANGSGGGAFGGGIGDFLSNARVNVTNSTVAGNSAVGGGGTYGDGLGGGIAVFQGGVATISGVVFAGNRASGSTSADGSTGSLGGGGALLVGLGFGSGTPGFTFPDQSSVVVTHSTISGNGASGGSGLTAGAAEGGGIDLASGNLLVQSSFLAANSARGGSGSSGGQSGNGSGGGVFADYGTTLQLQRSNILGNFTTGGPVFMGALAGTGIGGGLYIQPTASVTLDTATVVVANSATTSSSQIFGPYTRI